MKLYLVNFNYSVDYEYQSYDTLGIFDSKERAEATKEEYLNKRDVSYFDYAEVVINEMELNKDYSQGGEEP